VVALWLVPRSGPGPTAVAVGAAVVVAVVAALRGWQVPQGRWSLAGAGVVAGALSTLAATPGPPVVVAYHPGDPVRLRANLCLFFLLTSAVSTAALVLGGGLDAGALLTAARLLPGVAAGLGLGLLLRRRVPAAAVRPAALWLCLVSGGVLLVSGAGHLAAAAGR